MTMPATEAGATPAAAMAAADARAGLAALEEKAAEAARLLRLLANENRLLVLCHLAAEGEATVGALAEAIGLSQPALSQHLARLREDGLVATRRAAQAVFYRLDDPKAARLLIDAGQVQAAAHAVLVFMRAAGGQPVEGEPE